MVFRLTPIFSHNRARVSHHNRARPYGSPPARNNRILFYVPSLFKIAQPGCHAETPSSPPKASNGDLSSPTQSPRRRSRDCPRYHECCGRSQPAHERCLDTTTKRWRASISASDVTKNSQRDESNDDRHFKRRAGRRENNVRTERDESACDVSSNRIMKSTQACGRFLSTSTTGLLSSAVRP